MKIKFSNGRNQGCFACCSCNLQKIIRATEQGIKISSICGVESFTKFKDNDDIDIHNTLFEQNLDINIEPVGLQYETSLQWSVYSDLDLKLLNLYIKKYFNLSNKLLNIVDDIHQQYSIDLDNTCAVVYRGNDKQRECDLIPYDKYRSYVDTIIMNHPDVKLLVQTDEMEFLHYMLFYYPERAYYLDKHTEQIYRCNSSVDERLAMADRLTNLINYICIIDIICRMKYIIYPTGNTGLWLAMMRGNTTGTIQI